MNKQHPNMKFTDEKESNNTLSFLDVSIIRDANDEYFTTTVFRKKTFSGVLTNWQSSIFEGYKISLIYTMIHRCYMICSNYKHFHDQITILKDIFQKNGYPMYVIDLSILRFMNKLFDTKVSKTPCVAAKRKSISLVLPYLGKFSISLKKQLENLITQSTEGHKVNVVFSSARRLKDLFKFKDVIPVQLSSFVIYQFTCRSCQASYIGKTHRHYKQRVGEHIGHSHLTNKKVATQMKTAVACHSETMGHMADWKDFKIIGREHSRKDLYLKIKESLLIKLHSPSLVDKLSEPLKLFQ